MLISMYELHENEQYFFDAATLARLTAFLKPLGSICCLCTPLLGEHLERAGAKVCILDVDERFAKLKGFRKFDIYRPAWQGDAFDVIVCDPPFYNVSLSQLFSAIRALAQFDFQQPMMVSYLKRREPAVLGTFAKFGLRPSGYFPTYQTVERSQKNEIEFFTNLDAETLGPLVEST